ncbi:RNA-directed DNA polymerase, eukaryota [Tanacetum coccineum]
MNGTRNQSDDPKGTTILKSVILDASDLIDTSAMKNVILVKVRDVNLILNINNVLRKEGLFDFQCKYIGGLWLLIEFENSDSCHSLQSNKEMAWFFTQMKPGSQTFKVDERVVWIKIDGLPLNAWTSQAYKKIASNWGRPLFVDEDPHDSIAVGRVCVRTTIISQIIEVCKMEIYGRTHNVKIKEFARWVPDIEAMDSRSQKNSDMDNSENRDECPGDNDVQEEEDEIRDDNATQVEGGVYNIYSDKEITTNVKDNNHS